MNQCSSKTLEGKRCKNRTDGKLCYRHNSKSDFCKNQLRNKIRINMDEYKTGRWKSPKQAVAVSYSQVRRKYPQCK